MTTVLEAYSWQMWGGAGLSKLVRPRRQHGSPSRNLSASAATSNALAGRLCVLGDLRRRRLVVEGPLVGQLDDLGGLPAGARHTEDLVDAGVVSGGKLLP